MAITSRAEEVTYLPPIEQNQFVSRVSPQQLQPVSREPSAELAESHASEMTFIEEAAQEQAEVVENETSIENSAAEEMCVVESTEEKQESAEKPQVSGNVSETSIDTEQRRTETSDTAVSELVLMSEEVAETQVTAETNEESMITEEEEVKNSESVFESKEESKNVAKTEERKIKKKCSHVSISKKTASDEQEDPLITKLDKKIDKELRALQGNNNDDDDDDDDVEDETLNDLLHGQRAKELDEFLKT